ncbi:hypothetical protein LTR84_000137 [Exophiala bonariae]|uniref:TLDc domain-containing protein n=1 Tax=Exophiala bonariae TaxID=1690606 RepID=A0AAV9NPP4_9EURO|nr:hypothetical protein LTR84_000137 [Exophiala bonariae]
MGQSQSSEPPKEVPIEQLSHELALRFASKCFTHLEITHYKDNFKSLADHQEDVEYWKEDTLCRFLAIPELLQAGSVLYQMCTYLGAFPFPSLAPCILTREAMLKVITIMTGRYKKILKRGDQDKAKLLFRSLAVFDRSASHSNLVEKPTMEDVVNEQLPDDMRAEKAIGTHVSGFAIDEPANDDEEEDEDDLALAALDALDAIEVFKQDQRVDRKIHHAMIPVENFKKLVKLLLLLAGIEPLTPLAIYGESLTPAKLQTLDTSADAIIAAFDPDPQAKGIRYSNFVQTITSTLPDLFDPLNALFEHSLFSKNINLSKHRDISLDHEVIIPLRPSPIRKSSTSDADQSKSNTNTSTSLLNDTLLSQISTSLKLTTPSGVTTNIFTSGARFDALYSTSSHGTSLSSFSRQVLSWRASTLIILTGTTEATNQKPSRSITLAAYLPDRWTDSSQTHSHPQSTTSGSLDPTTPKASLLLLHPRQALFPANPYNHSMPVSYFSTRTGIALGCVVPASQSRTSHQTVQPALGPVSLLIDSDLSTCTFQHDGSQGSGAFVTDPAFERAQQKQSPSPPSSNTLPCKIQFDLDELEVWGVSIPDPAAEDGHDDEITKQRKRLAWEEAEAARRRGVNFGGDKDGARALLEMAGIVGDHGNRSGGSV